jgi:hypothetical protein
VRREKWAGHPMVAGGLLLVWHEVRAVPWDLQLGMKA